MVIIYIFYNHCKHIVLAVRCANRRRNGRKNYCTRVNIIRTRAAMVCVCVCERTHILKKPCLCTRGNKDCPAFIEWQHEGRVAIDEIQARDRYPNDNCFFRGVMSAGQESFRVLYSVRPVTTQGPKKTKNPICDRVSCVSRSTFCLQTVKICLRMSTGTRFPLITIWLKNPPRNLERGAEEQFFYRI